MDLEVRHLRLVRAVATLGGLTRAGRELHLTQSALSHQLRDVETHLGTQIFLRVGKRMVLTSAGERLLRSADEILDTLERTEDAIRGLVAKHGGRLRVSTGCYTQYHWLPHVLRRLRAACPHVDVQIVAGAGRHVDELLLDGSIDVGIAAHIVEHGRLLVHPLFDDELVAVVQPAHRLASKRFLAPADFENEILLLDAPAESHAIYQALFANAGVRPGGVQLVAQTSAILELVMAGLGIALLTRWAVRPSVASGALRAIPLTEAGQRLRWNAFVLRELGTTPYVREFLSAFSRVLKAA
jgi:LysR family transcriptional regulator, regulator for metE and metH